MNKNIITIIIVAVVFAGGGFYGGMKYDQSQTQTANQNRPLGAGGNFRGQNGGRGNGGFTGGDVLSKDDKSITLKLRSGGSQLVFYSGNTVVMKSATGTIQDVITGGQVTVTGTPNADGSINAESIQIRPVGFGSRPGQ